MTATEKELVVALEKMLKLAESLMPGVRYIALQDYALLNDAPLAARNAIRNAKGLGIGSVIAEGKSR